MPDLLPSRLLPPWRGTTPALRRLLLSELFGLLAASGAQAGIAWWIASGGGAADMVRYGSGAAVMALLAAPLLSPWGDRVPKARLIRGARLVLVLDALALALLAQAGAYHLAWLCLCSLLSIAAGALLQPVEASILPELVPAADLPAAIRLRRGAQALGGLVGPALAGAALAAGGLRWAMAMNLLLFTLAAGVAWRVGVPPFPAARRTRAGWTDDLWAGLRAKWGVVLDRWWTLVGALMMVCLLPATGLMVPLQVQALGLSPAWFGAFCAALPLGVLAGAAGLAPALVAWRGRVGALAAAIVAMALAMAGIGLCRWAPGVLALFVLLGLCLSVTQLVGQTHRMLAMPEAFRARMTAANLAIAHGAAALAPLVAGALLARLPVGTVYLLLAGAFAASGLLLLAVPGLRVFLQQDHDSVRGWYTRHYPRAFAPTAGAPSRRAGR